MNGSKIDFDIDDFFNADENKDLPSGIAFEYYQGLKNREIWLDTDVDVDLGTLTLIKQILRWNREDFGLPVEKRQPIFLYCFSFGGDLDVCNSIIDVMECSTTPIYTVNVGRCMSAAAYIYIAGHKRYSFEKSYFLFHQGSGSLTGNYSEVDSQMEDYKKKVSALTELMKLYTNYTEQEIKKNIKKEWYVSSKDALENGVCDVIIKNLDELIYTKENKNDNG